MKVLLARGNQSLYTLCHSHFPGLGQLLYRSWSETVFLN